MSNTEQDVEFNLTDFLDKIDQERNEHNEKNALTERRSAFPRTGGKPCIEWIIPDSAFTKDNIPLDFIHLNMDRIRNNTQLTLCLKIGTTLMCRINPGEILSCKGMLPYMYCDLSLSVENSDKIKYEMGYSPPRSYDGKCVEGEVVFSGRIACTYNKSKPDIPHEFILYKKNDRSQEVTVWRFQDGYLLQRELTKEQMYPYVIGEIFNR